MCIAGAEEIAVKKAVIKNTSKQTTAKLSADVWHKYENALFQLNAMPGDSKKNVPHFFPYFHYSFILHISYII